MFLFQKLQTPFKICCSVPFFTAQALWPFKAIPNISDYLSSSKPSPPVPFVLVFLVVLVSPSTWSTRLVPFFNSAIRKSRHPFAPSPSLLVVLLLPSLISCKSFNPEHPDSDDYYSYLSASTGFLVATFKTW
jgi:hypothetical protein